jgi:hypothetical protein
MFKECLDLASVDAVLNLLNVKVEQRPVEEEKEVVAEQNPEEVSKE